MAKAADVVAGVEGVPPAAQVALHPGAEIHRRAGGNADIAQIAGAIAGGDVQAAAEGDGQMGIVAADADLFPIDVVGALGGPGLLVVKGDVVVDPVADGLYSGPA